MGYRSHVAFTIRGKKGDVLPVLMSYRLAGGENEKEALDQCGFIDEGEDIVITFEDKSTKWYDSYKDVQALTALYDAFDDENGGEERFACCFARIGEDDADIETKASGNNPYDLVRTIRTIEMEYDHDDSNTLTKLIGETA